MIEILRLGHRIVRDKRISTHLALVGRAFGADKFILCGQKDDVILKTVNSVVSRFGGSYEIVYEKDYIKYLKEKKKKGFKIVHLTMYGLSFKKNIKKLKGDFVLVLGGEKVPPEIYELADYNLSVTNQPHSEVAALGVFLDNYFSGEYKKFDGKIRIKPSVKGKEFY